MVGLKKASRNGQEVEVLVTTRGTFARIGNGWEQLHCEGQINAHWSRGVDGRFVRAASKYSEVLDDYNKLLGRK